MRAGSPLACLHRSHAIWGDGHEFLLDFFNMVCSASAEMWRNYVIARSPSVGLLFASSGFSGTDIGGVL